MSHPTFRVLPCRVSTGLWLAGLLSAILPLAAQAYCDEPADARNGGAGLAPRFGLPDPGTFGPSELYDGFSQGDALEQLGSLAREAINRSAEVRATQHAESASRYDLKQVEAGRSPQIVVSGQAGIGQTRTAGINASTSGVGGVGQGNVSVSAPLYDGGRLDRTSDYRRRLLESSGQGVGVTRESIVDEAVQTVIDRNRYRSQVRVYQQYAAKLSCLAKSLEQIVAQDRGRASELAQARQNQRQAEIFRDESISALRQADIHLRKLVGDNVAPWGAIGVPLLKVPPINEVAEQIAASPTLRQLKLQADAAESLAQATEAQRRPQLNWQAGGSAGRAANLNTTGWTAGVSLSYVLDDGGALAAAVSAAQERAQGVRRQVDALMNERVRQASQYAEAAQGSFKRAQQYAEVLRDSDQVRNATFEQWSKLGRRSLFDLMSAEATHYQQRISYINALHDGFSASAQVRAAGSGLLPWIAPELAVQAPR